MAQSEGKFLPNSIEDLCGTSLQHRRFNMTQIESMINRALLICGRAIAEAERTGENYTREIFYNDMKSHHATWPADVEAGQLIWIYPNNKRLPKEFGQELPEEYRAKLNSGDIHTHVMELLYDSYIRLMHLHHGLRHILKKINQDGHRLYPSENQLTLLRSTFEKAVEKSSEVLREIRDSILTTLDCDVELSKVDERIVKDFEYRELKNWVIFREYANLLQLNIEAFKILIARTKASSSSP